MLEEARALGELREAGLEAEADDRLLPPGTARSRGCSDRPNGSRQHAEELREARRRLHQHRRQRPRLPGIGGSHTLEKFVNGVARDIDDPETKRQRRGSGCRLRRIASAAAGGAAGERAARPTCGIGALGSGSDYTPFLAAPRRRRRSTSASAARTTAASTTRSTTTSTGTRTSPTTTSSTGARWRRPWARR